MKVLIIDHEPYSHRKYSHYKIGEFLSDGYQVEYLSLVDVLSYTKKVKYTYRGLEEFVTYVDSFESFKNKILNEDSETVAIVEFWLRYETIEYFKALKASQVKWVKIDYYRNPTGALNVYKDSLKTRVIAIFGRSLTYNLKNLYIKTIDRFLKLSTPNILFLTGSRANDRGTVVSINYIDVEEFNNCLQYSTDSLVNYNYIVFLDTMLVNHPDGQRLGVKETIDADVYYREVRSFFDRLETEFGFRVLVAAHPKSNYFNEFGDRDIIKNKTGLLVKHSEFVVTHGSLSIDFALLFKKPIVYLSLEYMKNPKGFLFNIYNRMLYCATELDCVIIDARDPIKLMHTVNINKYEGFLKWLYFGSQPERSNYDVLKSEFLKLIN